MSIISVTLPSDGSTADVADYNTPINTMLGIINGGLDDANISSLSGTKLTAATVPDTAMNAAARTGWISGSTVPTSTTYLGQRSFQHVYAASIAAVRSVGFRNKYTRSVAAPTQVTSLSGTKYWSKAAPNKFTFTTSFTIDVVINPTSYTLGTIVSVYNGTSGWALRMNASGQIQGIGYNAAAANFRQILSNSSVELGKETRITVEVDMAVSTNTPTTNYIMFNGKDVPATGSSGGTAPITLIQAGNLNVGAENAGTNPFQGNISQLAIFGAKVTQAQILTYQGQAYGGSETSVNSAYSFNGVATDLNTTTPNDLTANNSAGYATGGTFGNRGVSSTLEYSITMAISSDGLTETVQVPEGCMIPTSGGISALSYSTQKSPYGMPINVGKWAVSNIRKIQDSFSPPVTNTWYNLQSSNYTSIPVGDWTITYWTTVQQSGTAGATDVNATLATTSAAETDTLATAQNLGNSAIVSGSLTRTVNASLTVATIYYLNVRTTAALAAPTIFMRGDVAPTIIYAELALL